MATQKKLWMKITRVEVDGRAVNVGVLRGITKSPMIEAPFLVKKFNDEHGTNLRLVSPTTADHLFINPHLKATFETPVNAVIAYEKPGELLGKEIVLVSDEGLTVRILTGKYEGKPVALLVRDITAEDIERTGKDFRICVPEERLEPLPDFPQTGGWYLYDEDTTVPYGELLELNGRSKPEGTDARNLFRYAGSYVGLLVRHQVGGGLALFAGHSPSIDLGLTVEVPDEDVKKFCGELELAVMTGCQGGAQAFCNIPDPVEIPEDPVECGTCHNCSSLAGELNSDGVTPEQLVSLARLNRIAIKKVLLKLKIEADHLEALAEAALNAGTDDKKAIASALLCLRHESRADTCIDLLGKGDSELRIALMEGLEIILMPEQRFRSMREGPLYDIYDRMKSNNSGSFLKKAIELESSLVEIVKDDTAARPWALKCLRLVMDKIEDYSKYDGTSNNEVRDGAEIRYTTRYNIRFSVDDTRYLIDLLSELQESESVDNLARVIAIGGNREVTSEGLVRILGKCQSLDANLAIVDSLRHMKTTSELEPLLDKGGDRAYYAALALTGKGYDKQVLDVLKGFILNDERTARVKKAMKQLNCLPTLQYIGLLDALASGESVAQHDVHSGSGFIRQTAANMLKSLERHDFPEYVDGLKSLGSRERIVPFLSDDKEDRRLHAASALVGTEYEDQALGVLVGVITDSRDRSNVRKATNLLEDVDREQSIPVLTGLASGERQALVDSIFTNDLVARKTAARVLNRLGR